MKITVERSELLKSLGHVHRVVERRNTIPILANVLLRADRSKLSLKATDLDVEVTDTIAAEVGPGGSTTVPAHMFFDIVRKLPEGAQIVLESSGDRAALAIRAGRSRFTLQTLAGKRFSRSRAGRDDAQIHAQGRRPQAADRQDPVRHLDRGDALLPQRHLSARRRRRQGADAARGGDRRPSAGADGARIAEGRRRHAGHHRAAQDRERGAAPDGGQRGRGRDRTVVGKNSLHRRRRHPDLEADRRHVPRLRPRHSAGQRQGTGGRQEGIRGGGRSRLDGVERARPRRQTVDHRRQAAVVRDQSGFRQRQRGARGRIRSPTRSISASTRATCSTSPRRSRARPRCSSSPIRARRR